MKRSKHNLSYYNLTTAEMGKIVPIGLTEVLPNDTIQHHTNVVIRMSPMAAPIMHSINARVHHFFVPHRLVWPEWENFITGGPDGNDSSTPPSVVLSDAMWDGFDLFDYYGIPRPNDGNTMAINALALRGYKMIYNEFYRDQDLAQEVPVTTDFSNNDTQHCAWERDYLTTCRPWTQKGPDVTLPVGTRAELFADGAGAGIKDNYYTDANGVMYTQNGGPQMFADLTSAEAINVNDFRKAFALQRYQEARARYGSRYVEYLRYLGVRDEIDARLQRPEFLGGGSAQVSVSEVLQTAPETAAGGPSTEFGVGDMYGHGIAAMRSNKYRRHIPEHGYIHTFLSVRPKAVYSNAVDRTWLKFQKEDYFQKELQHIGQQQVSNNEVYSGGGNEVFGYQDRYAEYRQGNNRVTAEFRDLLNYWHLSREFAAQPVLNQSFVDCVPSKRIHNEQTQHAMWIMCQHKIGARRLVDRSAMARIY